MNTTLVESEALKQCNVVNPMPKKTVGDDRNSTDLW
jgi:hypothetical protein